MVLRLEYSGGGGGGGGTLIFSNIHRLVPFLWVISMHFRVFSESHCTKWGLLKFQIFLAYA